MGKPVRRFFLYTKVCCETRRTWQGYTKTRQPLSLRPTVVRLVHFLSGQLPGGFAEPFHCFQILPHGFHGKRVRLLSGGQLVDLPLPCLRGDCLTAVFQFFQIPGCCVIQDQFPAVALLKLFPLFRLYFGKLFVDGLVLFPHLPAFGKSGDPALSLGDLSPQVIVTCKGWFLPSNTYDCGSFVVN